MYLNHLGCCIAASDRQKRRKKGYLKRNVESFEDPLCVLELQWDFLIFVAGENAYGKRALAAVSETPDPQNPKISAEKDSSNVISNNPKKPKSRIVSSRYTSPSTSNSSSTFSSRRYPSPLVPRNSTPAPSLNSRRSVSVDRRRPSDATPLAHNLDPKNGNASSVSAATRLLVTSTRSLSVSFQGEAFSLPVSKTKVSPSSPNLCNMRKGTPEKRSGTPSRGKADFVGGQIEHCKPADQHRWPARNRLLNPLSRSLGCSGNVDERSSLSGSVNAVRSLQRSMIDERRASLDGRLSLDLGHSELPKMAQRARDGNVVRNEVLMPCEPTTSDSDSVSSGSNSSIQEYSRASHRQNGPPGMYVSAKFWQETNSRMRRLQDPGSPLSASPGSKLNVTPRLKQYTTSSSILSSPRTMSSPIPGSIRAASPSKLVSLVGSSPLRGHSPSRIRNAVSTINNNFTDTPSVLSFAVDVRRGKVRENKILDAHILRLQYNRHLQWRFVNARTEAVLLVQKRSTEKNLLNAWITISDLRNTISRRKHRLQLIRQTLKLASVLRGQMIFLEDWASLDEDHLISLVGAIEALKASTLRLPVVGGNSADVQSLQEAIGSSIEIMRAMTPSIHLLVPMVEEVNNLVSEVAKLTKKERALLEQCTDLISLFADMQVKDSSLRTHIIQCNRVRTA